MSERNLNEADLLNKMSKAISDNDPDALSKLFEEEDTQGSQSQTPELVNEPAPNEPSVEDGTQVASGDPPKAEGDKKKDTPGEEWLAQVPEELRDNILRLKQEHDRAAQELHRYKSDHGRVAAYQRKADRLEKELEQLRKQKAQQPPPRENLAAALNIESDEDFKALLEADPTFARLHERQLKKIAEGIEQTYGKQIEELRTRFVQTEEDQYFRQEQQKLLTAVPNAVEVISHPAWREFKDNSPAGVRTLAESDKAEDLLLAMQLYAAYVQNAYPQEAAPNNEPLKEQTKDTPTESKIVQERQRKLQGSPGVSKPQPTPSAVAEDDEALFKRYYEQARKENGYS